MLLLLSRIAEKAAKSESEEDRLMLWKQRKKQASRQAKNKLNKQTNKQAKHRSFLGGSSWGALISVTI